MILVDTGRLIALFDPKDHEHRRSVETLRHIREPLLTTVGVLTNTFHIIVSDRLRALSSAAVFPGFGESLVADVRDAGYASNLIAELQARFGGFTMCIAEYAAARRNK